MLLDTHVWIWAAADVPNRIGPKTRRRLEKAAAAGSLYVSTASALEVTALCTAGRLVLSMPAERWIRDSVDRSGLRVADIDMEIAIDAGQVPASTIPDPLDRLLVATARSLGVPLVTRDRLLLSYIAKTRLATAVDARV